MSDTKIAGDYTDRKGVQAHLGLMILLLMTLVSKDNVDGAQATATIFIALTIPFFLVSLVVLPTDIHDEESFRMQLIFGMISMHAGHLSGLIALAFIFGSFSTLGATLFILSAIIAYVVFVTFLTHRLGSSAMDGIWSIITGKKPSDEQDRDEPLVTPVSLVTGAEEADESPAKADGRVT